MGAFLSEGSRFKGVPQPFGEGSCPSCPNGCATGSNSVVLNLSTHSYPL